ncbi:MocR-like pyridoxine biosynthesis transcription factor PdxR [Taibaiella soli]|uniref:PLP-dependent aminotransferase family protein n=1 Tax=Taibaiella soli TaxID=1649169 RepID=A0A2W2AYF0_9BACT|nr:PLP-dependent aminotransferase family protein [Taibaiella soli]PZF72718.1 PLP-dependent aminotransferase family protein [Taibaiella soli]
MLPYKTLIQLNRDSNVSLYVQLGNAFIGLITNGTLQPNDALPSSRVLSELLGLNRNTVKLAYEELIIQDWVVSIERKGIFVSSKLPVVNRRRTNNTAEDSQKQVNSFSWHNPFEGQQETDDFQQSILTIDDGFPDVRLTPVDLLMREYRSIAKRMYGKNFLKYGFPKGSENLREALRRYLSDTRGLNIQPENILITKGSQMGIYLATQLLFRPNDKIAVGVSNYRSADEIFRYSGVNLLRIPVDSFGMDVDVLEDRLKREAIKAVYIIPHHHFPTTVTMSTDRRLKLLELARQYRFAIIEDDYDFDFHYSNKPYLPLASIDHNHNVIYIGSITKTFAPALRIGFLIAEPKFVDACSSLRQLIDKQGDSLLEEAFSSLYNNGEMERHFRKAIKIYQQRRNLFCEILNTDFKDILSFDTPEGGLAVWSLFDKRMDLRKLSQLALKKGLKIADGSFYENEMFKPNGLRMGFASLTEQEILKSLETLKKII